MKIFACALILFASHPCLAGQNSPEVTVLYSFTSGTHAPYLDAHPVPGSDGNIYGFTKFDGDSGHGTEFQIKLNRKK